MPTGSWRRDTTPGLPQRDRTQPASATRPRRGGTARECRRCRSDRMLLRLPRFALETDSPPRRPPCVQQIISEGVPLLGCCPSGQSARVVVVQDLVCAQRALEQARNDVAGAIPDGLVVIGEIRPGEPCSRASARYCSGHEGSASNAGGHACFSRDSKMSTQASRTRARSDSSSARSSRSMRSRTRSFSRSSKRSVTACSLVAIW